MFLYLPGLVWTGPKDSRAAVVVFVVLTELGILRIPNGADKKGACLRECSKKAGRFPHLQLVRMVSEASGTHQYYNVFLTRKY